MHVIIGSGPIGANVARLLADRGERVRIVTRSGSGPEHALIERVAGDAADAQRLTELARGAEVVYNCANPKYTEWADKWPPMNHAMIEAARAADAVYAITGNLYGYGPQPGGVMTEDTPLAATGRKGRIRARMWQDALASGVRTVEARASDYVGAGAVSTISAVLLPAINKGRAAMAPGDPEAPHTFTYTGDMARTLVTLARDERAWGKPWHVPSGPAISMRELADRYCDAAGVPRVKVKGLPRFVMRTAGLVVPIARELAEMDYQFYAPFHMDSSRTQRTFGLTPTDLDVALRETAAAAEATAARRM
ncbi:NAD-dependent epimerase/dehydratase [Actinoplanes sp. SE50]|uniref:NAD-dependent epimerase/dehydratase family protein n=1 Tax=unclassified Actinoplanes TaxID=2626549 RepID=UPI00023ED179|nr:MULTISPECIES: NAD-dependent epimerase/dehydratase family protein [unclassified Actinoplanes]AEV81629.1 NAD-dependent epimerase/dehydratase [Actinoplanes sp. SE50/110]ATO80030.1 NAD-dependent epimerase/dehydratase [Actinoplanes sp. SE50]SLL97434.1 NAD-dependent epimerase [Actinoplanes sp. SE50/110]